MFVLGPGNFLVFILSGFVVIDGIFSGITGGSLAAEPISSQEHIYGTIAFFISASIFYFMLWKTEIISNFIKKITSWIGSKFYSPFIGIAEVEERRLKKKDIKKS